MSDFSEDFTGITEFSSRFSSSKVPEKSSFSETCSLLSQYLKENGGLGDLRLGIEGGFEAKGKAVMPRLPEAMAVKFSPEKSVDLFRSNFGECSNVKSIDLLPQSVKKSDFSSSIGNAQMTVFYDGKVMVFDEVPANKATEIMALASKGSSMPDDDFVSTSGAGKISYSTSGADKISYSTSGAGKISYSCPSASADSKRPIESHADGSDLPIARRASLHRFLAKRKDRFNGNTENQINKRGKKTDQLVDLNL